MPYNLIIFRQVVVSQFLHKANTLTNVINNQHYNYWVRMSQVVVSQFLHKANTITNIINNQQHNYWVRMSLQTYTILAMRRNCYYVEQ